MSLLPPTEAIAFAVRRLEARGFVVTARNGRGDSVYLACATGRIVVRVSNHARTPAQRRKHPDVTTSLVIRKSRSAAQIETMVSMVATRFLASEKVSEQETA